MQLNSLIQYLLGMFSFSGKKRKSAQWRRGQSQRELQDKKFARNQTLEVPTVSLEEALEQDADATNARR